MYFIEYQGDNEVITIACNDYDSFSSNLQDLIEMDVFIINIWED